MPLLHSPAAHGFDPHRLTRIDQLANRYLDAGHFAGLVTLVARHGHLVHLGCHGYADAASQRPMAPDTICRIFSMTKPITGAALMICLEEGRCHVTDPVSTYIPAFADLKVWQDGALVPLDRPVTIQDLYRHTAGLTYGGLFGDHPVDQMYSEANIGDPSRSNAEFLNDIAQMPLRYQPGSRWHYSMAMDVLGGLIEILTDQPFAQFLQERILGPLGMVDASFRLDPAKAPRLATLYKVTPTDGYTPLDTIGVDYGPEARFEGGGGGLLSTPLDYLRFAQCLLNGGVLDGQRILGRKSVEFMASNALTPAQMPVGFDNAEPFDGFGYGVCVKVMQDPAAGGWFGSVGDFGWGGYAETYHIIDPKEQLVAIMMAQCIPSMHYPIRKQFRAAVYQALT
ncbi:MAG: beta-lactamase family protein [Anaerolineales bacterium]|nr:beta-lactamase family protein [Anaerolineales bacterium]